MAKKQGHYCKVCGMYQSNESFSGKGHNAHICKKCAALTPEERSREATLTRLLNLPYRLSAEQKAWLKGLQKDKCQEIAETARAVYAEHFPYAKRNERKKQLHINEMTFAVHDELWDEYGDPFDAQITFTLDRKSRLISCTQDDDTDTSELSDKEMRKLLNRIVNEYEVFCWEEDFSQANLYSVDEDDDEDEDSDETENGDDEEQPSWFVLVSYSNGEKQQMKGFDIPLRINELALDLLQYFEDGDDMDFDNETYF